MAEDFLYFVWQYSKYPPEGLTTVDGKTFYTIHPGYRNTNSGPDFNEAKIKVDGIEWFGQVEMHIKSSEWFIHRHQEDPAYNNVVLHVVWEHDAEVTRKDGTPIPTVELKEIVDKKLLNRYRRLLETLEPLPCAGSVNNVDEIKWLSMLERCAVQRLERKASEILTLHQQCAGDWEEVAYQLTLKYLGFKVNAAPMQQLSKGLPYKILKKNAYQPQVIEALLFGQAGFLQKPSGEYQEKLKVDFRFYQAKYDLVKTVPLHLWKFLRMRPANFPTLRLAQFAAIVVANSHLFDLFLNGPSCKEISRKLRQPVNPFWENHYHFNKEVKNYNPVIGTQAVQLLIINVIAPLRAAYSIYVDNASYMESALDLLQQLPIEKNKVIHVFDMIPYKKRTAFDSQAMLSLFDNYCSKKQCLNCEIGISLVK